MWRNQAYRPHLAVSFYNLALALFFTIFLAFANTIEGKPRTLQANCTFSRVGRDNSLRVYRFASHSPYGHDV